MGKLMNRRLSPGFVSGMMLVAVFAGCQSTSTDHEARMSRGYIYFCDGAGGGGLVTWSGGLRKGLKEGGYPGTGEIFKWNTGLGVIADQKASIKYKRSKAREMAQAAAAYTRQYPGAPVTFVGLSAGTSVVVFALEALLADTQVENVVLCGASISSTYDLTRALQRVRDKFYVFTSDHDAVLGFLVPISGTADRKSGFTPAAGLRGFRMPVGATPDTRRQYAKVVTIPWRPEFTTLGYAGGHTGALNARFVEAEIAPRLAKRAGTTPTALGPGRGRVRNPDYERWAQFGVGSYVVTEGYQEYQGVRSPVRVKTTLRSKSTDRLETEREFILTDQHATIPAQVHSVIAEAWIEPEYHPTTDPATTLGDLPAQKITVKSRTFSCPGRSVAAAGNYSDWGSDLTATVYRCPDLPGGLAELKIESHFQGEPFKFEVKSVDFKTVP